MVMIAGEDFHQCIGIRDGRRLRTGDDDDLLGCQRKVQNIRGNPSPGIDQHHIHRVFQAIDFRQEG